MIGDVVGQAGCDTLREKLPRAKAREGCDLVIANGENAAEGNGILPQNVRHLFDSGVDVITTGNHVLRRREIYDCLDSETFLLRPANLHTDAPGRGVCVVDRLKWRVAVVNLMGIVYMEPLENPFSRIDKLLEELDTRNVIVDFHAEATSEKQAMGFYLDGRVSALVGTHTHVATADARILPRGTAYITDVGMCGGINSVLGVRPEQAIYRLRTGLPVRFENVREDISISAVCIDMDTASGKALGIRHFFID